MDGSEQKLFFEQNIRRTWIGAGIFFVAMVALGVYFEPQLEFGARWLYDTMGLAGLSLFVFLNDVIISPLPGDIAVIIVSKSDLSRHWPYVILLFGALSTLSGFGGHAIGGFLRERPALRRVIGKNLPAMEEKFRKYGRLLVILGATTPVPYSLTTWVAGLMKAPRKMLIFPTLLRIPRFFVVYLLLAKAKFVTEFIKDFNELIH
jgi:membrane protein YqaA with SNARE-associated domain